MSVKPETVRVVFWQNMAAFYQAPHITALACIPGYEVIWAVNELITPDRVAQGWSVPDVKNIRLVVSPDAEEVKRMVSERQEDSVHIFTGVHLEPLAKTAFEMCVKTKARIGLLNEPPIPGNRLRNLAVRPYHFAHRLLYGRRINFILAIGHMSVSFYKSIGFPQSRVFPYGYFPDLSKPPAFDGAGKAPVNLIYVGQLIRRKGVDVLLEAVAGLSNRDWLLTIVGNGVEEKNLKDAAIRMGIKDRVKFLPPAPNAEVLSLIAKNDVFLLPSRHDGWGTVINEALLCGVPVVCSDHCGAADLLCDEWRGSTFKSGSSSDLTTVLERWIAKGPRTEEQSRTIQNWCKNISGRSAAEFVASVIAYSKTGKAKRPQAPWLL